MNIGYAQSVVQAHRAIPEYLGSFKPPTLRTVVAAEAIKERLAIHDGGAPYPNRMAVSVTELSNLKGGATAFVVAFSGYHPNFKPMPHYQIRMRRYLRDYAGGNGNETIWWATELDKVYHPMHTVSRDFFASAFAGFSPTAAVTAAMVSAKIQEFKGMFQAGGGRPAPPMVLKNNLSRAVKKSAFAGVIGGALALRMNMILDSDVPIVVRELRGFIRHLKGIPTARDTWQKLARFMESVMRNEKVYAARDQEDISFLSTALDTGDAHLDSQIKAAVTAWGGNQYGRYCAEPKGYAAARQLFIDSRIVKEGGTRTEKNNSRSWVEGQLAFWHASDGDTFRVKVVKGPEGAEGAATSGAYMVPCESCKNRSGEMIIGI